MDDIKPIAGDIWKELDPRPEYQRYVKVTGLNGDHVRIYAVYEAEDGVWLCVRNGKTQRPAPERWAQAKRFNGKRGGYEIYRRLGCSPSAKQVEL